MTNMPDEIVWARIMTALDLEFQRALHYHDEGYDSENDYRLPTQVMRPFHVYSVSTTEDSFNPTDYNGAQCPIFPFTPRWSRDELPFHQRVCQSLTFEEPSPPAVDSDDDLMTWYGLRNLYLIAKNACAFTRYPATPPTQPNQVEVPQKNVTEILEELPDLIDVPEELLSDFDSWPHCM